MTLDIGFMVGKLRLLVISMIIMICWAVMRMCPILETDWAEKIKLGRSAVNHFCSLGCSVDCAKLFIEEYGARMEKAGIKVVSAGK